MKKALLILILALAGIGLRAQGAGDEYLRLKLQRKENLTVKDAKKIAGEEFP